MTPGAEQTSTTVDTSSSDWTPRSPAQGNPLWFGPAQRPLAGWLHFPAEGTARAAVVLCPPLGLDAICVYFSYRQLAVRLAESGFAVLRFDYDGTGDSSGNQTDPARVAAWVASVASAVELVEQTGAPKVALLGIRMGALLAAAAADGRDDISALVLWDPCLTGSRFLREQQALHLLSVGGADHGEGAIEIPGMIFDPDAVADLGRLRMEDVDLSGSRRTLVLQDPDRPPLRKLADQLSAIPSDWIDAIGQSALLDPPLQKTPHETIGKVVAWLADRFDAEPAVELSQPPAGHATVVARDHGVDVRERFVQLGSNRLFGILTDSVACGDQSPTVVFVNEGNTPHTGQSRMWVELSRKWAASGLRVLRWDLSGNGDSEARPGRSAHVDRAPEAFDDVRDAVSTVSQGPGDDVILVGLCSGGYQAVESALTLKPLGICLLNPIFTFVPPESQIDPRRQAREAPRSWTLRVARRPVRWLASQRSPFAVQRWTTLLEDSTWVTSMARRYPRVPGWLWVTVKKLSVQNLAAPTIERVARSGTDVFFLCGERDFMRFELGSRKTIDRLHRLDNFHLKVLPGLDHAALALEHRRTLMNLLTEHVVSTYVPGAGITQAD